MTRATWKYVFALVSVWLLILGYMGWQLLSVVEDSNRNVAAVMRKERHVEVLQEQNERLKQKFAELQAEKNKLDLEIGEMRKKNADFEQKLRTLKPLEVKTEVADKKNTELFFQKHTLTPPSKNFSTIRRRAEKELKEIWYYLSAETTNIKLLASDKVQYSLSRMLKNFEEMHHALSINMDKLKTIDGQDEWRNKEHKELGDLVQKRLHHLQNPKDCKSAKKLICQLNKGCGYGCQVHHLMYCFIVAYGYQRTLIIDSSGWRYSSKGWNGIFKPVSESCSTFQGNLVPWVGDSSLREDNILMPIVDSLYPRPPYMPLAVPQDLAERLQKFHGHPFVWWMGQFAKYLFRYAPEVEKEMNEKKNRLGFKKPIVGIQVRRTDKINTEAAFHSIEEYMYWVDLYYNKLEKVETVAKRRVYLATDDPQVLPEAKDKYKNYEFVSDLEISRSAGLGSRYSDSSLHGVVFDIQMLSECNFLVCTLSSQVCRVAYEIMQASQPDAADKFQSLDDIYYYGGQSGHNVRAIYPHQAEDGSQIDLQVGDLVGIAGNHWDGFSKGTNQRTHQGGLFPSYKAEDVMDVYEFPLYKGV